MQSNGMSYSSLDHRKVVCKNSRYEKVISLDKVSAFKAFSKTDGRTLWLIEVLYSIKRDVPGLIGSKESCMRIIMVLTLEMRK